MIETRPYYSEKGLSAAYYDQITALDPSVRGDVDIYARLSPPGGSILELGAGTGRVSLALAERGIHVLGIDLAPTMLAQAQAKLAKLPDTVAQRLRFQRGDMTSLNLDETFDAVICPFFGLSHLPAGAAWKNVFAGVAKLLKPGGYAGFHVPDAGRMAAATPPPPDRPVLRLPADDRGESLVIYIAERVAKPEIARFDQAVDYVIVDPRNQELRRVRERLTYYAADPTPYAVAVGLIPGTPIIPMSDTGYIQVFHKPQERDEVAAVVAPG
jgi:SAM-dependent methyltransferase